MRIGYAEQYGKPCVIIEPDDEVSEVIEFAEEQDAVFWESPEDKSYVVQFPDRPKELYTRGALMRSFYPKPACSERNRRRA